MINEFYLSSKAPRASTIEQAIRGCRANFEAALDENGLSSSDVCICRFFCSDVYNQAPLIAELWPGAKNSQRIFIGQLPLDSNFISHQAYLIKGLTSKASKPDGSLVIDHGAYQSLWTLDYPRNVVNPYDQTQEILESCQKKLARQRMTFADNVIRTWYYLRDIDNTYSGMIKSRIARYEDWGLTCDNHFIASTGIEGQSPWPHALVGMQAHAVKGLDPVQITYLKALDHLSPTQLYGVNFERATRITYGDRSHCHISGTASIDNLGNVVHIGNVRKQAERTLENINAILSEGGMSLKDMLSATVYLRDAAAFHEINDIVNSNLPHDCAINFTCGAVCRPDWLIEIDGEAGKMQKFDFPNFI